MATITMADLIVRLEGLDTREKIGRILRPVAMETALDAQGRAQVAVSGRTLSVRTGRLRQSIAGTSRDGSGGAFQAVLKAGGRVSDGSSVRYAGLHEYGGTIRPVRAKMLRIPLPAALTSAGVDRMATPLRATAPGMFHVRRSAAGNLVLIHNETGVPWYVLKSQSVIPARPYLRPALKAAGATVPGRVHRRLLDSLAGA
jgi:phage gpG-like protein